MHYDDEGPMTWGEARREAVKTALGIVAILASIACFALAAAILMGEL